MTSSGRRTAVVVAHPDDEALWLSPAIGDATAIVFCFGAPFGKPRNAAARRAAVAALSSYPIHDLAIAESGAGFEVDWPRTRSTASGIEISAPDARRRYEHNFGLLLQQLALPLAGITEVYTHNPWGEYGHAEHVQVHRVVATLQAQLGFRLWYSNYVGPRSWTLANRLATKLHWAERREVAPDLGQALALRALYRRHGAWTWSPRHCWPAVETHYLHAHGDLAQSCSSLVGERLLDTSALRRWRMPWRAQQRTVTG